MHHPANNWYKASDGTAAVDMQVALITPWHHCGPEAVVSFMAKTADGPIGAYTLEFSDGDLAGLPLTSLLSYAPDLLIEYPSAAYIDTPDQPAGAGAEVTAISVSSIGEWVRAKWTPTSGSEAAGDGHLPTEAAFSYGEP